MACIQQNTLEYFLPIVRHSTNLFNLDSYWFQRRVEIVLPTCPWVGSLTRHLFVVDPEAASRPGTVRVESDRHRRRVTDEIVQVVAVTVGADSLARR